ncbi:MAG TPA: energy transducer TonB [Gemmatimonadales bacterium]|nr:energy transducer TonB [Gemmatimonadales bacterium]
MPCTLLESDRTFHRAPGGTLASLGAHAAVVGLALALTAGDAQLPRNEREARVFFLLPPDRELVRPHQMESFHLGKAGVDFRDGTDLTRPAPGFRVAPQDWGARGREKGSGAKGATPFGPVSQLRYDTVFSVLDVDRTVERYEWSSAPAYPPNLAALGTEGVVRTMYVVDTLGVVDTTSIRVVYSDDPDFTASVIAALGGMRFRPARKGGRAVRQEVQQQFRFRLDPSLTLPGATAS